MRVILADNGTEEASFVYDRYLRSSKRGAISTRGSGRGVPCKHFVRRNLILREQNLLYVLGRRRTTGREGTGREESSVPRTVRKRGICSVDIPWNDKLVGTYAVKRPREVLFPTDHEIPGRRCTVDCTVATSLARVTTLVASRLLPLFHPGSLSSSSLSLSFSLARAGARR